MGSGLKGWSEVIWDMDMADGSEHQILYTQNMEVPLFHAAFAYR
jgi:hypothetical protein